MNQSVAPTLTAALRSYLEAKRLDGYGPRTLYSYRRQLQHLAVRLGSDTLVDQIQLEHLRTYLSSFTHLKTSSLANRVRVVKVFFKWLHEEETLLRNPAVKLKEPRLPHRIPKALSIEEVELLRDACKSPLEHALIEFFFATGCRGGEVHGFNHDKLDWTRRSTVVLGKGNKEREVYFGAKAALWLRRCLSNREDLSSALFVTDRRRLQKDGNLSLQRMSISQMQRIFKRIAARCGLATRVTHTFYVIPWQPCCSIRMRPSRLYSRSLATPRRPPRNSTFTSPANRGRRPTGVTSLSKHALPL